MNRTFKHIIILIVASLWVSAGYAQDDFNTIFKKNGGRVAHGGYGAIKVGYTNIEDRHAIQIGLSGGWIINHSISLGLASKSFFNNLEKSTNANEYYLGGMYGGFQFEVIAFPGSAVHLSFPVLIGGGALAVIPQNYWDGNFLEPIYDHEMFFVVEPAVELEFNLVRFFRLAVGSSYRFTNGTNLSYPNGQDVPFKVLDGFDIYLNFKFGKF